MKGVQEALAAIVRLMRTTLIQPMFGAPPEPSAIVDATSDQSPGSRETEAAGAEV